MSDRYRHRILLVGFVLGVAATLPVTAADPASASGRTSTKAPESAVRADAAHQIRMSRLIGIDVADRSGRKLGTVKDAILDTRSGRVHYAILSFGGVLGIGDRLFAVPLAKLEQRGTNRLVLDVDREQLKSAPGFASNRWPDWNLDPYRAEVDKRWGSTLDGDASCDAPVTC